MKVALCVCGSAAIVRAPIIARKLSKKGIEVTCYLTDTASKFVSPHIFKFACKEVITEITGNLEHLREYDVILVAPATANTISKIVHKIADNCVTCLVLASRAKKIIAPAMNERMYLAIRDNIEKLREEGFIVVEPIIEEGKAKLADDNDIVDNVIYSVKPRDFAGKKILITAGATLEYIDPIRVITNKSSGKMGVEIAKEAYFRGGDVSLIVGRTNLKIPTYLNTYYVETSKEMLEYVKKLIRDSDIYISAAAITDFVPEKKKNKKIKTKDRLTIKFKSAPKIFEEIKDEKALKVGFKALYGVSSKDLIKEAIEILKKYNLYLVFANDLSNNIIGSDETEGYLIKEDGEVSYVERTTKAKLAEMIMNELKNAS